jgi:hypothetical protein
MIRSEAPLKPVHHSILLNVCGHLFAHDYFHSLGQGRQDRTVVRGSRRITYDNFHVIGKLEAVRMELKM